MIDETSVERYTEEQELLIESYRLLLQSKYRGIFGRKRFEYMKEELLQRLGAVIYYFPWENPHPGVWSKPAVAPDHRPALRRTEK